MLKRSPSSVSREFARNSREDGTYSANYADKQYVEHRENCGRKPILENEQAKNYVVEKLEQRRTLEQIACDCCGVCKDFGKAEKELYGR